MKILVKQLKSLKDISLQLNMIYPNSSYKQNNATVRMNKFIDFEYYPWTNHTQSWKVLLTRQLFNFFSF